jgi:hypothetical protein
MGTLSVLFHVSYSPLFVALVPRERFVEGGSIMHGSRALSYVAGPSIGGALVPAISAPATLVVDACSYVVSALFLQSVEVEEPEPEPPGKGHVVAGVRWVFANPTVRAALGATATINSSTSSSSRFSSSMRRGRWTSRRERSGSCSGPAQSAASWSRSSPTASPQDRNRPGVRRRLRRVPRAAGPRAARRGTAVGDPRVPLPRRVRFRARRDDARHHRRCDLRRSDPRPAPLARLRRVHGRQLRRSPARRARGRSARDCDPASPVGEPAGALPRTPPPLE